MLAAALDHASVPGGYRRLSFGPDASRASQMCRTGNILADFGMLLTPEGRLHEKIPLFKGSIHGSSLAPSLLPLGAHVLNSSTIGNQGGGNPMKRMVREQKRFIRRWAQDSGSLFSRAVLLGTAFLFGMVAA